MAETAVLEVIACDDGSRWAVLRSPCNRYTWGVISPPNEEPRRPPVNIAATVLAHHIRDCGCAATAELERRYAPMAARIREHGG